MFTTQISLAMKSTSALSGKRAIRFVAVFWSSFCVAAQGRLLFISAMRERVSEWCTRVWLNDFARDAYVMSVAAS